FAADGQVCRMRFYPKRVHRNTVYANAYLNFQELKWILNRLAPPSARGDKKQGFGFSDLGGGILETEYAYEKVSLNFVSALDIRLTPEDMKKGEFLDFELLDNEPYVPPKPSPPSESDFVENNETQIVSLRWNDRPCAHDNEVVSTDKLAVARIE